MTTAEAGALRNLRWVGSASRAVFVFMRRWPVLPAVVLSALVIAAILGPFIEPYNPLLTDLSKRNTPPVWAEKGSAEHLLGTDPVGRDILSRIIRAARITVIVVLVSQATGMIVGSVLGLIAGYFGGILDEGIMRLVDMWSSLPYLLVVLTVVVVFGQGFAILVVVLALLSWPGAVRLVRAQTLALRTRDYVALSKVAGAGTVRILYHHILPGVLDVVVVTATLHSGTIILTEATLSFLGAGVPPPNPSWGSMVADGRQYMRDAWWVAFWPGMAILLVVMAGNFLGDWLRDHFDPRLRQV